MLLVCVLRLLPTELAVGRVVGQVEHVASRNSAVIHNVDELLEFLARCSDDEPGGW